MKMSEANWNTLRYTEGDLMAFISFGAIPDADTLVPKYIYSLIVSNKEFDEISEQLFETLPEALTMINQRFSTWNLTELNVRDEGGCSSCAAH